MIVPVLRDKPLGRSNLKGEGSCYTNRLTVTGPLYMLLKVTKTLKKRLDGQRREDWIHVLLEVKDCRFLVRAYSKIPMIENLRTLALTRGEES